MIAGETLTTVLEQILAERGRQNTKWGEQNHPSFDPVLMERDGGCDAVRMCVEYEIPTEARAKSMCEVHAYRGDLSWPYIAVEELSEAVSTLNEQDLRGELIQLAAVIVQWIECIDRRAAKEAKR